MKWKTAALLVLLIFTASAFAITSTVPVMADDSPTIDPAGFGGPIGPCDGDDIPSGPGAGP